MRYYTILYTMSNVVFGVRDEAELELRSTTGAMYQFSSKVVVLKFDEQCDAACKLTYSNGYMCYIQKSFCGLWERVWGVRSAECAVVYYFLPVTAS